MSSPEHLGKFYHDLIESTVSIYVAGPFIAKSPWETYRNTIKAEEASAEIWQRCGEGVLVLTPHLNSGNMIGVSNERTFINAYLKVVSITDATFVLDGWEKSKGTKGEIIRTLEIGKPVFFRINDLVSWVMDYDKSTFLEVRHCTNCGTKINNGDIFYTQSYAICNECLEEVWENSRYQPKIIEAKIVRAQEER